MTKNSDDVRRGGISGEVSRRVTISQQQRGLALSESCGGFLAGRLTGRVVAMVFLLLLGFHNLAFFLDIGEKSLFPFSEEHVHPLISGTTTHFSSIEGSNTTTQNRSPQANNGFNQTQVPGQPKPCPMGMNCTSPISSKFLARNTLPFDRFFCGHRIQASGGAIELDSQSCPERGSSYVYTPSPPTLNGSQSQPIELLWNGAQKSSPFECTVPCRQAGTFRIVNDIKIKDTPWEITLCMEGHQYHPVAEVQRDAYKRDHYYAVTSFQSEVPVPYFSWAEYSIQNPAVDFDKAIKGASFLARNCNSKNDREGLVSRLAATDFRVDSLSSCLRNAEPPPGVDMKNKIQVLQQYLFHLAFENQCTDDYITEKLWGVLQSGTLPIYFGAPNVKEHVPPNSVVFVDDFSSTQELADFLIKLSNDKELYESYHAWRSKPLGENFTNKYAFTAVHSTCRMCKWAYAKRHGLAWNHPAQEVEQPRVSHQTCRNKLGFVRHPFQESWSDAVNGNDVSVQGAGDDTCQLNDANRVLLIDNGSFQRDIYDQDGITDLWISGSIEKKYHLRLETPILDGTLRDKDLGKEWWFQDSVSRLTILLDNDTEISNPGGNVIQIVVSGPLRIRLFVEDVDTFHVGAQELRSYFGGIMKQDFVTPIEVSQQ